MRRASLVYHFEELIAKLVPGGEIVITHQPRQPGSAKGKLKILVDDKEHLKDFEEYLR